VPNPLSELTKESVILSFRLAALQHFATFVKKIALPFDWTSLMLARDR
jgi:hypothetical protein